MNEPRWWSQAFRPEGGAASDGIRRQLGTPSLDPLTVLVRETAQNSWDARLPGSEQVHFSIGLRTVRGTACGVWRELLAPGSADESIGLGEVLGRDEFVLLIVSDRGTSGLGGPVRSGRVTDEQPDFANFVRNVGERRDRELGGGTYGFGKASLYGVAASDTVIVSTRCSTGGVLQRRLMGTALGHSFNRDGHRFTGRHWWGHIADDDVPDPVLDEEAEALVAQLGLPTFLDSAMGTDLVVVGARLGTSDGDQGRSALDAGEMITSSLVWYLWPKLVDWGTGPAMVCSVTVDGKEVPIPDPRRDGVLSPYVESLRKLREANGIAFSRNRAPRIAGHFASHTTMAPTRIDHVAALAAPFDGPSHHCARMRHVELVVDYLPGPELPDAIAHYGAVFKATDEADEHFAAAEPPTHDAWVTRHLSGTALGVVRDSTTFVKKRLQELLPASAQTGGPSTELPLGGVSRRLARALPGGPGLGGGGSDPGPTGRGSAARRPFRVVSGPVLAIVEGVPRIQMEIEVLAGVAALELEAVASVATDGGRESAAPIGGDSPVVERWVADDGTVSTGSRVKVAADGPRRWITTVRPVRDTATAVDVRVVQDGTKQ